MRFLLLVLCLISCSAAVFAQSLSPRITLASAEDVAIAFYKTAGIKPAFTNWIKPQEPYISTAPFLRPGVLAEEKARLEKRYDDFDPASDTLAVRINTQAVLNERDGMPFLTFVFPGQEAGFFPFPFLEHHFALIPSNPEKLSGAALQTTETAFLRNALKQGRSYTLIVELAPQKADISQLHDVDGVKYWAFTVNIIVRSLWDETGALLWEETENVRLLP